MVIMVLADTHLGPGRAHLLTEALGDRLLRADAIVHAGDITDVSVIEELSKHAPVTSVRGNNDIGVDLPETVESDVCGVMVAMIHDSGAATGRGPRLHRLFPSADVVVFGHSHLPWNETIETATGRQIHFNPGSPTQRRRAPAKTIGWIERGADGRILCRHEEI